MVTPPTIYYYFGNKDQLFQAVINKMLSLEDFRDTLVEAVEKESDPGAKLGVFIQHYMAAFPRGFFNPGLFLQSSTQLYGASTERVMGETRAIHELAKHIIQEGIQSGVFRKINVDKAREYLMNLLMAYVLSEVHYYQTHDPEKAAEFITNLYLNGLCLQAGS